MIEGEIYQSFRVMVLGMESTDKIRTCTYVILCITSRVRSTEYITYVHCTYIQGIMEMIFNSTPTFQKREDLRSTAANCSKFGCHCVIAKL